MGIVSQSPHHYLLPYQTFHRKTHIWIHGQEILQLIQLKGTHNHLIHGKFMKGIGCWLCLLRCHIPFRKGSMFLGDWRAFKELVIKRSCVKAVCRSSTWRWHRVPLIVQKSSDDHLGCIKEVVNVETKYYHIIWWLPVNPCKSWDKLPTSTGSPNFWTINSTSVAPPFKVTPLPVTRCLGEPS